MSNAAILSNEASPLKTLLINTSEWSCFEYAVKSNAPNMVRNRIVVQGPTEPAFNRTEQFNIPRYGLWAGATLRYKLRIQGANSVADAAGTSAKPLYTRKFSNWLAAYMVNQVTLQTHNKPIQDLYPQTMIHEAVYGRDANYRQTMGALMGEDVAYLDEHTGLQATTAAITSTSTGAAATQNDAGSQAGVPADVPLTNGTTLTAATIQGWLNNMTVTTNTAETEAVEDRRGDMYVTLHLPLPLCFMDSTSSFLDTSFVESLNLNVKFANFKDFMSVAKTNDDGTAFDTSTSHRITLKKVDLLCDFIATSDATRKALQTANYKVDRPLTMLSWNSFKEQPRYETVSSVGGTVADAGYTPSSGAQIIVPIKCNGLASHTMWRLVDVTDEEALGNPGVQIGPPVQKLDVAPPAAGSENNPRYAGPCWSNVTIKASGITLVDMDAEDQLLGFGGGYARGLSSTAQGIKSFGKSAQSTYDGMNVICWGLDARSASSAYDSGSQSFKELVDCQLVVTLPQFYLGTNDDATKSSIEKKYMVEVFHKVYVLNTISSTDGRISQAISI